MVNLRYLEYLIALEETGNMTKAAQKLFISQSNLSQFLSHEEKSLGKKLFIRSGGKYTPTPAGALYIEYAKNMLALTRQFNQKLAALSGPTQIHIGTTSSTAIRMLEDILPKYRLLHPEEEVSILDCSNIDTAIYSLERGNMDLVFVTAHTDKLYQGPCRILAKEELFLAVPANNPSCARYDGIPFPRLTAQKILQLFPLCPFILPYRGSSIRYLVDDFFKDFLLNYHLIHNASDITAILNMVASGLGLGFIPLNRLQENPKIKYFSLSPKIYRLHAVFIKPGASAENYRDLIDHAVRYYKKNITGTSLPTAGQRKNTQSPISGSQ